MLYNTGIKPQVQDEICPVEHPLTKKQVHKKRLSAE